MDARPPTPQPSPTAARALWFAGPGLAEIRPAAVPVPGPSQVRARGCFGGLSRGTEGLVFRAEVPESEWTRMRAPHQEGDFPFPVKYGYAWVGEVEVGPDELVGRRVFGLLPHQTVHVVPEDTLLPLPAGLPAARAVLAANVETALNATWDLGPRVGESVTVVGGGMVGTLVAWLLARHPAVTVTLVDPEPSRVDVADAVGARWAAPGEAQTGQDAVVHASGSEDGLAESLSLVRDEGTVLELSWYGTRAPSVPLGQDFHARRLTLRSSQVGQVAAPMQGRRTHRQRLALALSLLADHGAPLDPFLTEIPFDDLPAALPRLLGPDPGPDAHRTLGVRIRYP